MIDIEAISTVIPKVVVDKMKFYITWCIDGFIKLDSLPFNMMISVKGVSITLNTFLDISIIQDIIVVYLPPVFGICLSREFTTKLDGYLAVDYTHFQLPFKNKYVKVPNEGTKNVHLTKASEQNYMNDFEKVENLKMDPVMESLLTIEILSTNELNYQVTNISMGHYNLHENTQPISFWIEKEYDVWIMYLDGTRCKHDYGVGVVFKPPDGHMKKFSLDSHGYVLIMMLNVKL